MRVAAFIIACRYNHEAAGGHHAAQPGGVERCLIPEGHGHGRGLDRVGMPPNMPVDEIVKPSYQPRQFMKPREMAFIILGGS